MNQLSPYDALNETGLDDLFRGFFRPIRMDGGRTQQASVRMDVKEDDRSFVVQAEIPGARKEDIHVSIDGNLVTLGAEIKRQADQKDGERLLRSERYYGNLFRSFTLPMEVDESSSEAKFDNGVLELRLAKKTQVAGKRLTVQ